MWIIPKNHPASCLLAPATADSKSELARLSDLFASSLMWRGKHTPAPTWSRRLRRGGFLALLSGRTSDPSTPGRSLDALIFLLAATHASPSPSPAVGSETLTPDTSGHASDGSSPNAGPAGVSSRTCAGMCRSGCETCEATWKAWAIGLRQDYSRRRKLGRRTGESESISLPTPTAQSYGTNKGGAAGRVGSAGPSLETMARHNLWPTPTVCGNDNRKGASPTSGDGLATADRRCSWPTPTARDWKSGSASPETMARNSRPLSEEAGPGLLNPTWVEWLMGVPTGWTACGSLETESSRPAPSMPSVPCTSGT
jgi:hypothetical protein